MHPVMGTTWEYCRLKSKVRGVLLQPRPVINKPPPLNKDYHRDPNIKALERKGFINHGSTLGGIDLTYHTTIMSAA